MGILHRWLLIALVVNIAQSSCHFLELRSYHTSSSPSPSPSPSSFNFIVIALPSLYFLLPPKNQLHSKRKRMTTVQTPFRRQRPPCSPAFTSLSPFLPTYPTLPIHHIPTATVAFPSPTTRPGQSRFSRPVPPAKPCELPSPRRGRDSRRRIRQAENFRRYLYLRRQLKPWSDSFRAKHGRTPSLLDVYEQDIPGLLERFVEYLDALENLRIDT